MSAKLAYTFEEAAEQSGYSVRTLKQQVADGNLAARYANTKGVIRHEDLAAWLDRLPAEVPAKYSWTSQTTSWKQSPLATG